MAIYDENGDDLVYWPISGLEEGTASETINILVDTPVTNGLLTATDDARATVYAREAGSADPWQDIADDPIDLSGYPVGQTEFEVYVQALSPISGFQRVPLQVTAGTATAAGWTT